MARDMEHRGLQSANVPSVQAPVNHITQDRTSTDVPPEELADSGETGVDHYNLRSESDALQPQRLLAASALGMSYFEGGDDVAD